MYRKQSIQIQHYDQSSSNKLQIEPMNWIDLIEQNDNCLPTKL